MRVQSTVYWTVWNFALAVKGTLFYNVSVFYFYKTLLIINIFLLFTSSLIIQAKIISADYIKINKLFNTCKEYHIDL